MYWCLCMFVCVSEWMCMCLCVAAFWLLDYLSSILCHVCATLMMTTIMLGAADDGLMLGIRLP